MSGGYFDYNQFKISEMAEMIQEVIDTNELDRNYSNSTIYQFKNAVNILKLAKLYVQRIDWLLEGDDSEESFHRRLNDEFSKLEPEISETLCNLSM